MKLKNIAIGDIVKVSSDEAFIKVCDYLGIECKPENNKFEVRYLDYDEEDIKTTWYVLIQANKSIEDVKCVSLKKYRLEVIEPTEVKAIYDEKFRDMLSFNNTGKEILRQIERANVRGIEKNYFSVVLEKGEYMVTCIPMEKMREFEETSINDITKRNKYCQKIKPIRIIQDILGNKLKQDVVDEILACINKEIDADFHIVSGEDITKYYSEKRYIDNTGTLGNSCMRYEKLGKIGAFHVYEDYAQMVILKDKKKDKIYGRAILWTLHGDKKIEGKQFMDRIYTTNDSIVGMFKKFAIDNNMFYLDKQSYSQYMMMFNEEEINMNSYEDIYVNFNSRVNNYMFYPYIDTFQCQIKEYPNRLYPNIDKVTSDNVICKYAVTGGNRSTTQLGRTMGLRNGGNE